MFPLPRIPIVFVAMAAVLKTIAPADVFCFTNAVFFILLFFVFYSPFFSESFFSESFINEKDSRPWGARIKKMKKTAKKESRGNKIKAQMLMIIALKSL